MNCPVYQVELVPATAENGPGFGRTEMESDVSDSTEEWRPISGFEGRYEVSNRGRVRGLPRRAGTRNMPGGIRKLEESNGGHYCLRLSKGSTYTRVWVHTLVLEMFVGPRPDGLIALHNNGNGLDNRVENLRWGTIPENALDSVRHGTHANARKTHCKRRHEFTADNTGFHLNAKTGHQARYCRMCDALNRRRRYRAAA